MNIAVYVKRVPDLASVEVNALTGQVDKKRLVYITDPAALRAVEEALRIREAMKGRVTVFSVGDISVEDTLRECLGMGVDRVYRIRSSNQAEEVPPSITAHVLAQYIKANKYDLVLCGDTGSSFEIDQVPAWIAEYLALPLITAVTNLRVDEARKITAQRRLEKGKRQSLECNAPSIATVDVSINEPRECSLASWISAHQSSINTADIPPEAFRMLPACNQESGSGFEIKPLRPDQRVIFTPDNSLPAHERVSQMISGGMAEKKVSVVKSKNPAEAAESILDFLVKKDLFIRNI
ncbi:Electron transfer flavoprotein alpha/beta- subunit [Desulfofarcimen acetoxidans DSM 771]|uniref:Electron transfer flavoprotein alpha/beta-subunit n=1 Tax=Desulfofarcimen acetoxidans (strain ATCC 49208 / DSM 771 / KCTC 5769 / VKM B-1644 / 5575) TaxID=485916 RepID=C8VZJ6_DESAS|nr:Electron transfer flavoprotein alpha/beta- subunit [Desulfofarcimen acetoxidans]ACV64941.1 Electron transfer flavoprotein alpha/beta- subunit [Desulfofarcimen acetoxidans DSM 771]